MRVSYPEGTGFALRRLARLAKPDAGPQSLCEQGRAGGAASTSPGLTQSQPHSKNGCALACLCQEALKDTLPCADRTNIPSSFPEYRPGEAPTSIAQLGCTRLCKTLDSPTGTFNSLTEEMAGEAYETNPVATGLGRGLPSLHSFH